MLEEIAKNKKSKESLLHSKEFSHAYHEARLGGEPNPRSLKAMATVGASKSKNYE